MHLYLINIILLLITAYLTVHHPVNVFIGGTNISTKKYDNFFFCIFWIILLAVEFGLGGSQTSDYANYKTWFSVAHNWSAADLLEYTTEQGFYLLNFIGAQFISRYSVFRIFYGLIISLCFFKVYQDESDSIWVSLMVFICTGLFYRGLNLSSQLLAAAIYATSFSYIYKRKLIPYVIVVIIASLFHQSAIFLLPLYFIPSIRSISNRMKMVIVIGILIAGLMLLPHISGIAVRISRIYYGSMYEDTVFPGMTIQYFLKNIAMIGFIILCNRCFDMKNAKEKTIFIGSILYGVIVLFSFRFVMIQRFMYYLMIFIMLAFAVIAKNSKKKHALVMALMVAMFLLMQVNQVRDTFELLY